MKEKKTRVRKPPEVGYSIRLRPIVINFLKDMQEYTSIQMVNLVEMALVKLGYIDKYFPINIFQDLEKPEERRKFKEWQAKKREEKTDE